MGAGQSTVTVEKEKETLYEILGVSRDVSEAELRKIYKKQALLLHPDRNYDNADEAAKKFARMQAAYDVLSDPQERAWYDSHGNDNSKAPGSNSRAEPEYGGKITTAEELKQYIDPVYYQTVFPNGTDTSEFYEIVGQLFKQLSQEEHEAALDSGVEPPLLHPFGDSDSQWQRHVKPFYDTWSSFSSLKTFAWEDIYRAWDAPDRRSRRAMEMRNKKIRDAAKKEFNELVRSLVVVIRKKDPRVKLHNKASVRQNQNEAKERAEAARKKSNQQKKENAARQAAEYVPQSWENPEDSAESMNEEEEEQVVDLYECIVCDKLFKTKKQLAVHEESKKHIKTLKQMQREMRREGVELGLDTTASEELDGINGETEQQTNGIMNSDTGSVVSDDGKDSDEEDGSDNDNEKKDVSDLLRELEGLTLGPRSPEPVSRPPTKKATGKAKLRRLKKEQANNEMANKCSVCNTVFSSRNKLFEHVNISGHAVPLRR